MSLIKIQQELKAPKNQFNAFAKYKYRSAEDIIEAAKPICHKYGYALMLSDEVIEVGGRVYVKATACLSNGEDNITCTGLAREEENKKGMDASQLTGACSSYARKYALNGLFAIDDTKDADATNEHKDEVSEGQKAFLIEQLDKTKFTEDQKVKAALKINAIKTLDEFNKIKETIKKANMKTAMQELKDWANQYKGQMISADQVVLKAHNLLTKEKEICMLLAEKVLDNLIEEDINEKEN